MILFLASGLSQRSAQLKHLAFYHFLPLWGFSFLIFLIPFDFLIFLLFSKDSFDQVKVMSCSLLSLIIFFSEIFILHEHYCSCLAYDFYSFSAFVLRSFAFSSAVHQWVRPGKPLQKCRIAFYHSFLLLKILISLCTLYKDDQDHCLILVHFPSSFWRKNSEWRFPTTLCWAYTGYIETDYWHCKTFLIRFLSFPSVIMD